MLLPTDLDVLPGMPRWVPHLMLATSIATAVTTLLALWLATRFRSLWSGDSGWRTGATSEPSAASPNSREGEHLRSQVRVLQDRVLDLELAYKRLERQLSAPSHANAFAPAAHSNSYVSPSRDSPTRAALRYNAQHHHQQQHSHSSSSAEMRATSPSIRYR